MNISFDRYILRTCAVDVRGRTHAPYIYVLCRVYSTLYTVSSLSYMLMRDAQNIASFVEAYQEVAHAAVYAIIQFTQFTIIHLD